MIMKNTPPPPMHENRLRQIQRVQELAKLYYEPGRLDRCMAEVWRRYVYRVYPICYETFRRWMAVDIQVAAQKVVTAKSKPLRYREKTLFEP